MPWGNVKLNDGTEIPGLAFGTGRAGRDQEAIGQIEQAVELGFAHIDTAQSYLNEAETGKALRESGLSRSEVYITTKFSAKKDVETSIQDSLKNLGVKYVNLYLIHGPFEGMDLSEVWRKFEQFHANGFTKSIGVCNYNVEQMTTLLKDCKVKPVLNQILFHPYVYNEQLPILEYCIQQGIAVEAYSPLAPIRENPGGPLDKPLARIAARTGATPADVLLAWCKYKGTIVITASSQKERLDGFIKAGDLELTPQDIQDIDVAGALGAIPVWRIFAKRLATVAAASGVFWGISRVLGLSF